MTAVQEMIAEFTDIQRNKCKTAQEVLFFDGVLTIIEAKYLPKEREQIEEAVMFGDCRGRNTQYLTASEYYTQTYLEPIKDKI